MLLLVTGGRTAYLRRTKTRIHMYKHVNILECLAFEMLCQAFEVCFFCLFVLHLKFWKIQLSKAEARKGKA